MGGGRDDGNYLQHVQNTERTGTAEVGSSRQVVRIDSQSIEEGLGDRQTAEQTAAQMVIIISKSYLDISMT